MRTVVLRVVALALLLLLTLVSVIVVRTTQRLPDTTVYFVRDQGTSFTLEAVYRRVGKSGVAERVARQIAALADGPGATEGARGLSSSVPTATRLLGVDLDDGVLSVDLNAAFEQGGGSAAMFGRLNQLYFTLTQPSDVDAVRLAIEGKPVTVFSAEGLLLDDPWLRSQHASLPVW